MEKITIYSRAKKGFKCTTKDCFGTMRLIMSAANFVTDETRAKRILGKGREAKGQSRGKFKN
jgi:hypothetical protein